MRLPWILCRQKYFYLPDLFYFCLKVGILNRRYDILILLFFLSGFCAGQANACSVPKQVHAEEDSPLQADSIMSRVISYAAEYWKLPVTSEAEIYIKGRTRILDKNVLLRFAHHLFPVNRNVPDMVFEMVSHSRFESPNTFFHDFKAIAGSSVPNRQKQQEILNFLNLNIYSSTAFNNEVLMPVARNAFRYYDFHLAGMDGPPDARVYRIRFLPKYISRKLVGGYMYVVDGVWTISRIELSGRYYFSDFILTMTYGKTPERFNLPETADLSLTYRMLGNAVSSAYHSRYSYRAVARTEEEGETGGNMRNGSSLDLSRYYRSASDTVPIVFDSLYWEQVRDLPLSAEENALYAGRQLSVPDTAVSGGINSYLTFTELITNPINTDYKNTYIRYYGILNPSQIGYSKNNGISYRQRMRIQKRFDNETQLGFAAELGFVSGRREFFFKADGYWEYWPEKSGRLSFRTGNGNQSYSFGMMKEINRQLADSAFRAEDLNLQYFRHYYVDIANRIDLFNGFRLTASLTFNRRNPVRRKIGVEVGDGVKEIINSDYHDLTSTVGISYTPRYYYRMDGRRKEYLYSHYPTLSVEFAKAIPGVWKSEGDYGRLEAEIQQSVSLGLLQKLNYHVSAGMYTSKKSSYFTDFRYFTRRNFPDTWDDQIGGVFNLLGIEWFYASDRYAQLHLMYENPFIVLQFFEKAAPRYVSAERFYLSQLWMPALPSYTEIGYGVGNHFFNIALFAGFNRLSYQGIGFKFSFELF
jgi:hypothetical protein